MDQRLCTDASLPLTAHFPAIPLSNPYPNSKHSLQYPQETLWKSPSDKRETDILSDDLHFYNTIVPCSHLLHTLHILEEFRLYIHRSEERRVGKECRSRWS